MNAVDLYKSMIVFPLNEIRKKIIMKSYSPFKKKKYNKSNKSPKPNCKTMSNELPINIKKSNDVVKIPQLKLYNMRNNYHKKESIFTMDKTKKLFIPKNKRIMQINRLYNNKINYFDRILKDSKQRNVIIEKYEKEIKKYIPNKNINYVQNLFNSKNKCTKNIKMIELNNNKTANKVRNEYNKSPYQLIQVFRNSSRLQKNYSSKNKKINLEFGLLSLNFKKPELKSKIINEPTNIINIKINDSNEEKESNVLEKSTSNNHKSSKNFLNSDKHKSNNNVIDFYKNNLKNKFFKIKKIDFQKTETPTSQLIDKNTMKFYFIKKINKIDSSIRKKLESKGKSDFEIQNENDNDNEEITKTNRNYSTDIKEIILKPNALKEINMIKKNEIKSYFGDEECEGESNESENKKLEKYEIGDIIGKGTYSSVKIAKNKKTNEKYAMKIYEKSAQTFREDCIKSEIDILKIIKHKNIAKYIEDINTENQIIIVQELVEGFSLKDYYNKEIKGNKNISDEIYNILKKIFRQIFEAMNYLHQKDISHRDIKLENILIKSNYEVKIIDFGFGLYNPEYKIQNLFCGTPKYIAPEIIEGKGYYGEKVDLWSLGVLIYKVYCDDYPFKGKSERELYFRIKNGKYKIPKNIPSCVKDIIVNLIIVDPKFRINCEKVLNSIWLN